MFGNRGPKPEDLVYDAVIGWCGNILEARTHPPFTKDRRAALKEARAFKRHVKRLGFEFAKRRR